MSRLTSLEERRNIRRAFLLVLAAVVVIVFALVWGVSILSGLAEWMGNLKTGGRIVDKNDLIAPVAPVVTLPWDATNSAQQVISGRAEPGAKVYLTRGGESIGDTVAREDGIFEVEDITLIEGTNGFVAVAIDGAGNKSQESAEATMNYSNKEPTIALDSPSDNQHVTGNPAKVDVKGSTCSDCRLTVNDRVVIVNSQGKFSTTYQLTNGDNVLVLVATDVAGNQTRKEIKVSAN